MLYQIDHLHLHAFSTNQRTAAASTDLDDPSNERLLALIQVGDESALTELMQRHRALLRTIISRVVHCDADVDDVLQDVFVEIWNRSRQFDATKGKALGWIVTVARRRAIDRVRRRQAYDRAEERMRLESEANPVMTHERSADEDCENSDRATMLAKIIETLPEAQSQALRLAFYRGLSQREIARETGIPLGTIKTRLELAIRKVRTALMKIGGQSEWLLAAA